MGRAGPTQAPPAQPQHAQTFGEPPHQFYLLARRRLPSSGAPWKLDHFVVGPLNFKMCRVKWLPSERARLPATHPAAQPSKAVRP